MSRSGGTPTSLPGSLTVAGDLTVTGHPGFAGHAAASAGGYILATPPAAGNILNAPTASQPAATGATNVTPFGYTTAAQADAVVTAVRSLVTDMATTRGVIKQVIQDLQSTGLLS